MISLLALLLAAPNCLETNVTELQVPFECPESVLRVKVVGNHELLEEFVRVDISRADTPSTSIFPLRTAEAAQAALGSYHWIKRRYELSKFTFTVEDRDGKEICSIHIEPGEDGEVETITGNCAGAGKETSVDRPRPVPVYRPGPAPKEIEI